MVIRQGLAHLEEKDCEGIMQILRKNYDVKENTNLYDLNVPVLLAYFDYCMQNKIDANKIDKISYPVNCSYIGGPILAHSKSFSERFK